MGKTKGRITSGWMKTKGDGNTRMVKKTPRGKGLNIRKRSVKKCVLETRLVMTDNFLVSQSLFSLFHFIALNSKKYS